MTYYFTFNDSYSGVYHSQVIDVVKLYKEQGVAIKLIAMVSPRNYAKDKRVIKQYLPDAIVLPGIPKLTNWKINKYVLKYFTKKDSTIVCRGVFATNIALLQKNRFEKVIYDGRGAIKAEQEEYGVYNETGIEKEIPELEKKAVIESDKRISVSTKLIEYWQREYQYNSYNHQIIPCSLGDNFENTDKDYSLIEGLNEQDILLVYSGSIADWQALDDLESILARFLENKKVKVLFLSKPHETIVNLQKKYPDRIYRKWVSPVEVPKYLALGDYGILLRKDNWTNRVASPVKFAEYLSVGLKVLISDNIGDFSKLVVDNNLGYVVDDKILLLSKIDFFEKERIQKYSRLNFGKEFLMPKYIDVIMS